MGFGVGVGNWLAMAISVIIPPLGLWPRIVVEDSELARELGEQYRSYHSATHRVVPGLW